jgi:DNA-binding NarL/FixJ family response regulator
MPIKLLIACIEMNLGLQLRDEVERESGAEISCDLTDMPGMLPVIAAFMPDVLMLEGRITAEALISLRQASPATRMLMLCEACTQDLVMDSVSRGMSGCLPRSSAPSLIVKAIRTVSNGGTWYGRTALLEALRSQGCGPMRRTDDGALTPREEEILHLIGAGLTNKEIGRRLDISDKTVKTHLHRVYVKLQRSGRYKAFLSQPDTRDSGAGWGLGK